MFYALIQLGLAAYLIILALRGKGKLFQSPYTKQGKEAQYKKTAQIGLCGIAGLLLALAAVNFIASRYSEGDVALETLGGLNFTLAVLILTALLVVLFLLNRLHDKEKKKMPATRVAPRAAFYFDEEEKPPMRGKNGKQK